MAKKFEKLLGRLPGPIRIPVEREWRPFRELFLERRAPRLLLLGSGVEAFVASALLPAAGADGEAAASGSPSLLRESGAPWRTVQRRGSLQFAVAGGEGKAARFAIASAAPDCFVLVAGEPPDPAGLRLLATLHRLDRGRRGHPAPVVAVAAGTAGSDATGLAEAVYGDAELAPLVGAIVPESHRETLLAAIAGGLPEQARLEFARVTGEKILQREIAGKLIRSATAVCAAIGAQPIPLADFPILTSLQLSMVAGIIHVAGREWSLATARDFLGALGINVGAGLLLREGARAALKFFPGFGNAISGAVAGAGTYAIGRAASAYFIEGLPIEEARRRFRLAGKRKRLPPPVGRE